MTEPHAEIEIQPLVNWPRTVRAGQSYPVTVDLCLADPATWPYDEEELLVGCALDGRPVCRVLALGDAGVVLHRFGGSYGPARFSAEFPPGQADFTDASLRLTLTTAGGVPFYTAELPLDGSATFPRATQGKGIPPATAHDVPPHGPPAPHANAAAPPAAPDTEATAPARQAGDRTGLPEQVTILHLRGLRFSPTPSPDHEETEEALAGSLRRDIADLASPPDLVVVTGNLVDNGFRSEYRQAMDFLTRLVGEIGVPRRQVVIVPGSHDVNRKACEAYFLSQEAEEQEPVPPYFPKWRQYAAAFEEFYSGIDAVAFAPDEPWTLFEMPALGVVVAGLNSTMAESHRLGDHYGELGDRQLSWFGRRLAPYQENGWIRLAAVHHAIHTLRDDARAHEALTGSGRVQKILSSEEDEPRSWRYDIVTVTREPEPSPDSRPPTDDAEPVAMPYQELLSEVEAATQVRFPDAHVSVRPEDGYLRISRPVSGGAVELRVVGVVNGDITAEAVDAHADGVHARFAAADTVVRSELVYSGPLAPQALITRARRRGIKLRSFVDYQGLLELRPLAEAQRTRLAGDTIYPAAHYVEQRFRIDRGRDESEVITGLIAQATDWLASSSARLIVVLGDFGRGKTSFLRQLTRRLPDELPDLIPVLVELRTLEKGPSLGDLLAQHLIRQGVEDFSQDKLRYMIESGRVALLFDGFDELELRAGYDSAADYLQSLLNSVTGQAKVILTSRTQHFRSTDQVRTALGQRVGNRTGSRMVILEDFSDDQIRDFLTGLYGDEERGRHRYELIAGIANLLELARNPRMLAFVAQLDDVRLRELRAEDGAISPAGLYEEIIEYWLSNEEDRQRHRRGLAWLTKDERFTVCTELALRLWTSGAPSISLRDLTDAVAETLTNLSGRGFSDDQAAHSIASGSLLVRTDEDTFSFVHQSIMEWLVAAAAAREIREHGSTVLLNRRPMSPLMRGFFSDLADVDVAGRWPAGDQPE